MIIIPSLKMWEFERMKEKVKILRKLGINLYRINLKTLTNTPEYDALYEVLIEIIREYSDIKLIFDIDLPNDSPRIRVLNKKAYFEVNKNEEIMLKVGKPEFCDDTKTMYLLGVNSISRIEDAKYIIYSNGSLIFKIISKEKNTLKLVADRNGAIWSGKSIHFDNMYLVSGENACMEIDFINKIPRSNIDSIALSFTQNCEQLKNAKQKIGEFKYICKIEDIVGVENLDMICKDKNCEGIYVGRGDLLFSTFSKSFVSVQSLCVEKASNHCKDVIIGTDILESMNINPIPSRSDMTDWCFVKQLNPFGVVLSPALSYSNEIPHIIDFMRNDFQLI